MSIHQTIYDTLDKTDAEVMEIIGAGDVASVTKRRDAMREFLRYNKWELKGYIMWLKDGKWTPAKKSRGLGDTAAKAIYNTTGIKSCVPCKGRHGGLNKSKASQLLSNIYKS